MPPKPDFETYRQRGRLLKANPDLKEHENALHETWVNLFQANPHIPEGFADRISVRRIFEAIDDMHPYGFLSYNFAYDGKETSFIATSLAVTNWHGLPAKCGWNGELVFTPCLSIQHHDPKAAPVDHTWKNWDSFMSHLMAALA